MITPVIATMGSNQNQLKVNEKNDSKLEIQTL